MSQADVRLPFEGENAMKVRTNVKAGGEIGTPG
jgi:hypothetical protein